MVEKAPRELRRVDRRILVDGAGGQAGVRTCIEVIRKELDVTMALTGVSRISEIDRRVLADWESNRA